MLPLDQWLLRNSSSMDDCSILKLFAMNGHISKTLTTRQVDWLPLLIIRSSVIWMGLQKGGQIT